MRTRPDINWDVLLESRSVSASQDTGRVASEVLYSVNVTLVTTRTIGAILVRGGVKASICLVPMTHFNDTSDLICRVRTWDDEKEMLSAFQAIQLTAANYNNLWQISTHWADPDNELAHTRVSWISPQLKERRGRVMSDVRTVATVNVFFLVGVTIVVAVLLMGCCLSAVTWWSNSGAPESVSL
ncbi:unnamed protein product [Chondrus crispus]|uniref:Uncharacterized protein n=1 Tax=Chondrus crispus TaxID=2769 RepID=R7QFE7_CHOCR|nr:unnamed protein product [Chondrus crispus]CDF36171.1 unnamed protein product [Chondrus crispus]|eukprot:XP_005715990.1 unnamed protein product [Chondrus crispus]